MLIFGIETSCDETACAVVENGRKVISNVVASQVNTHQRFGGVVPEVAAREHLESINFVIEEAFKQAEVKPEDIDGFAATMGPGLVGSLLIGANAAKTLAIVYNKPFLAVDHLQAHICASFLDTRLMPPFLAVLVSGGHTQIIKFESFENQILLAQTIDDAIGEVYDKVARLLNLPYPGGVLLDKMAKTGNKEAFNFPEAKTAPNEFSFSGLKTAVLRLIQKFEGQKVPVADICASFQECITKTIFNRAKYFANQTGTRTVVLAGGVAANTELRAKFETFTHTENGSLLFFVPEMKYCTDNAAMVASCAYFNPIKTHDSLSMEVYSRSR